MENPKIRGYIRSLFFEAGVVLFLRAMGFRMLTGTLYPTGSKSQRQKCYAAGPEKIPTTGSLQGTAQTQIPGARVPHQRALKTTFCKVLRNHRKSNRHIQ